MNLLAPGSTGARVPIPSAITAQGRGVFCVHVRDDALLTVASQFEHLVSCCRHLPSPGGSHFMADPPFNYRAPGVLVAVSAHCLHDEDACNKLMRYVGRETRLILLIPLDAHLFSMLQAMVTGTFTVALPVGPLPRLKMKKAVWGGAQVPETPVLLNVVRGYDDVDSAPIPQHPQNGEATVVSFVTKEGPVASFWAGLLVRAESTKFLRQNGVCARTIGVIECITDNKFPVVRFATGAVVLMMPVTERKGKPEFMPIAPCNSFVCLDDLRELMVLPDNWQLAVTPGVYPGPIQHLLTRYE